jgi:hypothetical protein
MRMSATRRREFGGAEPVVKHTFARSGENYANVAGVENGSGTLSQVLNTVPGATYALQFFLANDSNAPANSFRAVVNGTVLYNAARKGLALHCDRPG